MLSNSTSGVSIILVHGACHGPWCWESVDPPLRALGHSVSAVDLPLRSLYEDARVVREAIEVARRDASFVLLVGHSYGGAVVTEGGHQADHVVYLAGSMLKHGEGTATVFPRVATPELRAAVVRSADGETVALDPEHAR